jgi:hypothetical protein
MMEKLDGDATHPSDVDVAIEKEGVPGNATDIEGGVAAGEAFARTVLPFSLGCFAGR